VWGVGTYNIYTYYNIKVTLPVSSISNQIALISEFEDLILLWHDELSYS
jgi:hypothetical protein